MAGQFPYLAGKLAPINAQGVAMPASPGDRVTHARLEAAGAVIIGVDGHPDYPAQVGENMALPLGGTDHDRLTRIFTALAAGGRVKMPLTAQPGGAALGWLTDQFGINWMVQIDPA